MHKAPLGMLVTYTHITPRDDCPIRKVMSDSKEKRRTSLGRVAVVNGSRKMQPAAHSAFCSSEAERTEARAREAIGRASLWEQTIRPMRRQFDVDISALTASALRLCTPGGHASSTRNAVALAYRDGRGVTLVSPIFHAANCKLRTVGQEKKRARR